MAAWGSTKREAYRAHTVQLLSATMGLKPYLPCRDELLLSDVQRKNRKPMANSCMADFKALDESFQPQLLSFTPYLRNSYNYQLRRLHNWMRALLLTLAVDYPSATDRPGEPETSYGGPLAPSPLDTITHSGPTSASPPASALASCLPSSPASVQR
jgi:hypothetical protein